MAHPKKSSRLPAFLLIRSRRGRLRGVGMVAAPDVPHGVAWRRHGSFCKRAADWQPRALTASNEYIEGSRMDSKLSIALLEIFCGLSFVVCGVVLGFCVGWLGSPLVFPHDEQGLMRGLAVMSGAVVGTLLGISAALLVYFRLVRERRQRVATTVLALAALTALFTAVAVQHFNYW